VKRYGQERVIAAARAADGGADATGPAKRLISTAEALASVLAWLELADEPRLQSRSLSDVARVNDVRRAIPARTPRFLDTDDRRELHMTVEVRDRKTTGSATSSSGGGRATGNQTVQRRR
jgi:hypothetical protein